MALRFFIILTFWTGNVMAWADFPPQSRETIHITLNQNKFAGGDTIFFKVYYFDKDSRPVEGKNLASAYLVNADGNSVASAFFNVIGGIGNNQVILSDSIPAGYYNLHVIINSSNGGRAVVQTRELLVVNLKKNSHSTKQNGLKILTESGSLVSNITNKIVVRAQRSSLKIQLLDGKDSLIAEGITNRYGLASFIFIPAPNQIYRVRDTDGFSHAEIESTVDAPYIRLEPVDSDDALIANVAIGGNSQVSILVVESEGASVGQFQIPAGDESKLKLKQSDFPGGVLTLRLTDNKGTLLASRYVYSFRKESQPNVTVQPAKATFARRENVQVSVRLQDENNVALKGDFSVRVLNAALFGNGLGIERLSFSNPEQLKELDDLMIAQMMPDSRNVSARTDQPYVANIFQRTAKVYLAGTKQPVPDNTQVLFYLQRTQWMNQTFTLNGGSLRLNLPQLTGTDELFFIAETDRGKIIPVDVVLDEQALPKFLPARAFSSPEDNDQYSQFVTNNRLIATSYRAFEAEDSVTSLPDETEDFDLVEPDNIVSADKYVTFQSMEEMIREVIPSMFHRKNGNQSVVRMTLPDPMNATSDPVYIINGWATTDTRRFLEIAPKDLDYVAIVKDPKKLIPLKLLGKNGLVIVKTKQLRSDAPLNSAVAVRGLDEELKMSSIKPEKKIPDFRSTLYWNPSIRTDEKGQSSFEFRASDDSGEMIILVEGFTSSGKFFSGSAAIEIR